MKQQGFFSEREVDRMKGVDFDRDLHGPDCQKCGLFRDAINPRMNYTGEGEKQCLIIAEQPGPDEDKYNKQLIGRTGQWFRRRLQKYNLNLDRDFYKINSANCFSDKKPTRTQLQCCKPMIDKAIEELKPKFIWLFGERAITQFWMHRFKKTPVVRWRGLCIPDKDTGAWVLPMYHPSWPSKDSKNEMAEAIFDRDLDYAIKQLDRKPFDHSSLKAEECVTLLTDFDEVCNVLEDVAFDDRINAVTIDYEANCLKPFWPEALLASVSLSHDTEQAYSFPYEYRNHFTPLQRRAIARRMAELVKRKKLRAQNLGMEDRWTRVKFGVKPQWQRCTMVTAHVLDDRPKYTSLKFQTYLKWGIDDYGEHIRRYLVSVDGTHFNRIMELELDELLLYGGLDSLWEERLFHNQNQEMTEKNLCAQVAFKTKGSVLMSNLSMNGIPIDIDYYTTMYENLGRRMKRIDDWLEGSEEARKFLSHMGRRIDHNSNDDLQILFKDVLKIPLTKETATGYAVDKDVISKINIPYTDKILARRAFKKQRDTYIIGFIREHCNGYVNPNFNLHIPRTYRSSSDAPNFQNIPRRDKKAQKVTRSGILPSPGRQLAEWDYGSQEVRIAACHSLDPVLMSYIEDDSTDMHRDEGLRLFVLTLQQITKEIRDRTKNDWTFPELYGSFHGACARDLWADVIETGMKTKEGQEVLEHLLEVGVCKSRQTAYQDFAAHVEVCEREFWDKYKVHKDWQERTVKRYLQTGYVETLFGFKRGGFLKRNEIVNTGIQCDAYNCLEWSLGILDDISMDEKWYSKWIGQIHDSAISDTHPHEVEHILRTTKRVATLDIREKYEWIVVPLLVEVELTKVDESWYTKKEIDSKGYAKINNELVLMTHKEIEW